MNKMSILNESAQALGNFDWHLALSPVIFIEEIHMFSPVSYYQKLPLKANLKQKQKQSLGHLVPVGKRNCIVKLVFIGNQ